MTALFRFLVVSALSLFLCVILEPLAVAASPQSWGRNDGRFVLEKPYDVADSTVAPVPRSSVEQPTFFKDVRFDVWGLGWISTGATKHSHNASGVDPTAGNPTSTLDYKDLDSSIFELGFQIRHTHGWLLRSAFGTGGISSGRFVDDDFLSAQGAIDLGSTVSGEHLASRTFSDVAGDSNLWYMTVDVGNRLLKLNSGRGGLDGFIGFQYWREHYEGFGVTQIVCTTPSFCNPAGSVPVRGGLVISNTVEWSSIRLGLAADYRLDRLEFQAQAAFIHTRLTSEDTHFLRSDLKKPSITMEGNGIGFEGELALAFRVVGNLFLNAGYRYWYLSIYDGTSTHHFTDGDGTVPLTTFESFRHGVTFGASYRF